VWVRGYAEKGQEWGCEGAHDMPPGLGWAGASEQYRYLQLGGDGLCRHR